MTMIDKEIANKYEDKDWNIKFHTLLKGSSPVEELDRFQE